MSRAEAARLAGMERQALRDAVIRYNAEGVAGLHDRPKGRPSRRLNAAEEAALAAYIFTAVRPADGTDFTLVVLPPYSPELNPVERIWLYLRERFLSLRVLDDTDAIIEACCIAWNALVAEPGRLGSLSNYPWIEQISS